MQRLHRFGESQKQALGAAARRNLCRGCPQPPPSNLLHYCTWTVLAVTVPVVAKPLSRPRAENFCALLGSASTAIAASELLRPVVAPVGGRAARVDGGTVKAPA